MSPPCCGVMSSAMRDVITHTVPSLGTLGGPGGTPCLHPVLPPQGPPALGRGTRLSLHLGDKQVTPWVGWGSACCRVAEGTPLDGGQPCPPWGTAGDIKGQQGTPGPTGMGEHPPGAMGTSWESWHPLPIAPAPPRRGCTRTMQPIPCYAACPVPPVLCHAVSPMPCHPCPVTRAVPAAGPTRALLCSLTLPQASSFQTLLRQQARLEVLARRVTLLEAIIWPGNRTTVPPPLPA